MRTSTGRHEGVGGSRVGESGDGADAMSTRRSPYRTVTQVPNSNAVLPKHDPTLMTQTQTKDARRTDPDNIPIPLMQPLHIPVLEPGHTHRAHPQLRQLAPERAWVAREGVPGREAVYDC